MSKPPLNERAARFVEALRRTRNDRGKMASLRRGLSPSTVMDAWPIVAGLGGQIGQPGESVHVDIAALFAIHPEESNARDFGETCRSIALADSSDKTLPESHERRFRRLLACDDSDDLTGQLRAWIRLAANKGVGINYTRLFDDLTWWDSSADRIRVRWARSFWHSGQDTAAEPTSTPAEAATP
ncbi:MAG: type I-E CRISPR-associated protein Cse2/CasB [Verrucomicrobiae bacterium]|nr:type I-E CRISPR-associated protein Cse2/CasB [Verrucomicrobiae bacterium]